MHVLDRRDLRVLRRRGASDRDQCLAGCIGDQMEVEIAGRVHHEEALDNLSITGEKAMACGQQRKNHGPECRPSRPHSPAAPSSNADRGSRPAVKCG